MAEEASKDRVKVLARSPGRYPILVLETAPGELVTAYHETGYDLARSKPVEESWVRDNAIGRHSFLRIDPPDEVEVSGILEYVRENTA